MRQLWFGWLRKSKPTIKDHTCFTLLPPVGHPYYEFVELTQKPSGKSKSLNKSVPLGNRAYAYFIALQRALYFESLRLGPRFTLVYIRGKRTPPHHLEGAHPLGYVRPRFNGSRGKQQDTTPC